MTCSTCGRPMAEGRLRCMACGTMHNLPVRNAPVRNVPVRNVPAPGPDVPMHTMPVHDVMPVHRAAPRTRPPRRHSFTAPARARRAPTPAGLIPHEPVRAVQGIAWTAIVLICIEALMDLGVLGVLGFAGTTVGAGSVLAVRILTAVITFASFVVTVAWLWRCHANLEAFEHTDPRWRPGWILGAWFIPLANLILVPSVIADVARNSARHEADAARAVVAVWVWGVGLAITTGAYALGRGATDLAGVWGPALYPGSVAAMSTTTLTISLVLLLAMVAAQIVFVKAITDLQHARIAPESGGRGSHRS
jgi:hypothetical protein